MTPAHKSIKVHFDIHLGIEMGTVSEKLISVIYLDIDSTKVHIQVVNNYEIVAIFSHISHNLT